MPSRTPDVETSNIDCVVVDPTLPRWRRRYFRQPASGESTRRFTAVGAARGRRRLRRIATLRSRWDAACARETATRDRSIWP